MSTQVETQTYTGTLVELGGAEMAANGKNEKPRKVVIKDDPTKQYGKTFRTWHDSLEWNDLEEIGLGSIVTVEFVPEVRQGGPQGSYTVNTLVGVRQDGAGASASDAGSGGDWGEPVHEGGEALESREKPVTSAPVSHSQDDRGIQMEAAWAVRCVLETGSGLTDDDVVDRAVKLALLKRRVASELA